MKKHKQKPAIAIIPYRSWPNFKLWSISLDDLEWPLGRPERLSNGNIKNLSEDDHLITFPRKPVFFFFRNKVKANISLMIVEPDVIHKSYIKFAKIFSWRFYKILSKNQNLIKSINNGKFFYFGSTFLSNISEIDISEKALAENFVFVNDADFSFYIEKYHNYLHEIYKWMRYDGHAYQSMHDYSRLNIAKHFLDTYLFRRSS